MMWLFSQVWLWVLICFVLGFAVTMFAMVGPAQPFARRPQPARSRAVRDEEPSRRRAAVVPDERSPDETERVSEADEVAATERPRRRRRVYEVDDVEVERWDAGHDFTR
ncbi:hypothetical protein IEE94_09070 [Yimella sp. cx-573]|nr:hypothetical protein [Yimella sp. cx-573]